MNIQKERTLVLVKPEGFGRNGFVRREVARLGCIKIARIVTLNKEAVRALYPHLDRVFQEPTDVHLCGQQVAVFVVEGEDIIQRVVQLIGTNVNPDECAPYTLRYRLQQELGRHIEHAHDGVWYHRNFVHRAKSSAEAEAQIRALIHDSLVSSPL